MRVLQVVPSYLPAVRYGGPIVSVHALSAALARAGHEVHVFTTSVDGPEELDVPLDEPVSMDGVSVHYFRVRGLRRIYRSPDLAAALRAQIRGFDVAHLHSVFLWPTWAAARMARSSGIPYVLSPRGMLVKQLVHRKSRWTKTAWIAAVEKGNLERAAAIHVTSSRERADLQAFGFQLPRIAEIPNGVDAPADVAGCAKEHDVLYLGRITWKKGLGRLIGALARIPNATLAIAGNDEENHMQELLGRVKEYAIASRVRFLPPAYQEEKWRLLRSARCFVLPSYSENFGNVVLEAMAAGCPVIVTPEVGASSIVADSGGGIVSPGDPESLARAIGGLLADPCKLASMGEKARQASLRYSWDAVAGLVIELYREVIGNRPEAPR